jgi:hypothetical protein
MLRTTLLEESRFSFIFTKFYRIFFSCKYLCFIQILGTTTAQIRCMFKFLVIIYLTGYLSIFNYFVIILKLNQWSFHTRAISSSTYSSVFTILTFGMVVKTNNIYPSCSLERVLWCLWWSSQTVLWCCIGALGPGSRFGDLNLLLRCHFVGTTSWWLSSCVASSTVVWVCLGPCLHPDVLPKSSIQLFQYFLYLALGKSIWTVLDYPSADSQWCPNMLSVPAGEFQWAQ